MTWQSRICAATPKKNFMGITEKRLLLQESQNNFLQNLQKNHFLCFFTFISSMSDDKRSRQSDVRVSAVFHLYRCIFLTTSLFFVFPLLISICIFMNICQFQCSPQKVLHCPSHSLICIHTFLFPEK